MGWLVVCEVAAVALLLASIPCVFGGFRAIEDEADSFACLDGSKSIAHTFVNDGICDCEDGSDESSSEQCAFHRFKCSSGGSSQMIFRQRVNDGKCDCCDGSDEPAGKCPNTCSRSRSVAAQTWLGANRQTFFRSRVAEVPQGAREGFAASFGANASEGVFHSEEHLRLLKETAKHAEGGKDAEGHTARLDDDEDPAAGVDPFFSGDANAEGTGMNFGVRATVSDEQVESVMEQLSSSEVPTVVDGSLLSEATSAIARSGDELEEFSQNTPVEAEQEAVEPDGPGMYRHPTVHGDTVLFVSEDELWSVPLQGGQAVRLTAGVGQVFRARISPCGTLVAFSGSDEGVPEVFVMPIGGGNPKRLTYTGSAMVVGWTLDGNHVVYSTPLSHFHAGDNEELFVVPVEGGQPQPVGVGWSSYIAFGPAHCKYCTIPDAPCAQDDTCEDVCKASTTGCQFKKEYGKVAFATDLDFQGLPLRNPSVVGRFTSEISYWKRYHGGKRGNLWIDLDGAGEYEPLLFVEQPKPRPHSNGNIGTFVWANRFVVFVSDDVCNNPVRGDDVAVQCVANLFMVPIDPHPHKHGVKPEQRALERTKKRVQITKMTTHYVRSPHGWTDPQGNTRIVFSHGADLYRMTVNEDGTFTQPEMIEIDYVSPRQQRRRQFYSAGDVSDLALGPDGSLVALLSRGRPFVVSARESGPVLQYGESQGVRYTNVEFLATGDMVAVSDEGGESGLELFQTKSRGLFRSEHFAGGRHGSSLGRVEEIVASPVDQYVAIINHQFTLLIVDIPRGKIICSIQSKYHPGIRDVSWSPDGRWVAFTFHLMDVSVIKIMRVKDGNDFNTKFDVCGVVDITDPLAGDYSPSWDPEGNFLYFIGTRDFDPLDDAVTPRSMSFIGSNRPFLVTLNAAAPSPFRMGKWDVDDVRMILHRMQSSRSDTPSGELFIDLTNIKNRIVGFPVTTARYSSIVGLPGKRVVYIRRPIEPDLSAGSILMQYDFLSQSESALGAGIVGVSLSHAKNMVGVLFGRYPGVCLMTSAYRGGVNPSIMKCADAVDTTYVVDPAKEWEQIFVETWKRARDNFWTSSMNSMDWDAVLERYRPLLGRINTRSELSDLVMQLQGELGTSHAFQKGMVHRSGPYTGVGRLGVDVVWDHRFHGYKITALYKGDLWTQQSGPLARPGMNVAEGDVILKINGHAVSQTRSLEEMLLGKVGVQVQVEVLKVAKQRMRTERKGVAVFKRIAMFPMTVETVPLPMDMSLRYRDWVNKNREYVERKTNGKVGYLHIPNMSVDGWAEYHRAHILQAGKEATIIDVRYNTGGNISPEIGDKVSRKTLGYEKSRWGEINPYPHYSTSGPKVILVNEGCASDCDIFAATVCSRLQYKVPCIHTDADIETHCKLLGQTTWGGVVGINWKGRMVDNSRTSQPEFAHWFLPNKRGWSVEGSGVDPDIDVAYTPNHFMRMYEAGFYEDPQIKAALEHISQVLGNKQYQDRRKQCVPDLRLGERAGISVASSEGDCASESGGEAEAVGDDESNNIEAVDEGGDNEVGDDESNNNGNVDGGNDNGEGGDDDNGEGGDDDNGEGGDDDNGEVLGQGAADLEMSDDSASDE